MKRLCLCAQAVLILLVALPAAGLAAPAAAESCDPGYGSPADRIAACAGGYAEPARVAAAFQAKLGLSADTAGRLAQVMAQMHALEEDDENGDRDPKRDVDPSIRKIESQFIFLLRREADSEAVAVEAGWFYALAGQEPHFVPDPALFDLIRASADPARLAKTLIATVDGFAADQTDQIVLAALDVRPADSSLWDKAARAAPAMSWRLAFREEAFRTADMASPDAARLAAAWLSDLLQEGLTRQALAAYRGLPPDLRARLDRGEIKDPENLSDLRTGLAVTAFLEGDRETAGRLASLASQAPVQPSDKTTSTEKDAAVQLRLLDRMLAPVSDDPFSLFVGALDREGPFGGLETNTGELLLARLAEREGYPALTAYLLEGVAYGLSPNNLEPFEPARGVPPRVRANAAALAAERDALSRGYSQEARAAEYAARTGDGADPAAATIARLLRMPLPAAFEEHPLPADVPLLDLTDEAAEKQLAAAAKGLNLPTGVCLARVEREGSRVAAIVSSQGYDPTGEVSSGAYWLLLSADGGATWSEPLYTGLRINQPYVVRPVSALPLFAGDHLHVEVEIRELDPAKITFPPVGLAPKRTARGLFLDIPAGGTDPGQRWRRPDRPRRGPPAHRSRLAGHRRRRHPRRRRPAAHRPRVRRQWSLPRCARHRRLRRRNQGSRREGDHRGRRSSAALLLREEQGPGTGKSPLLHRRARPLRRAPPRPADRRPDPRRTESSRAPLRPLLPDRHPALPPRSHRPPRLPHLVRRLAGRRRPRRREERSLEGHASGGMDHIRGMLSCGRS